MSTGFSAGCLLDVILLTFSGQPQRTSGSFERKRLKRSDLEVGNRNWDRKGIGFGNETGTGRDLGIMGQLSFVVHKI